MLKKKIFFFSIIKRNNIIFCVTNCIFLEELKLNAEIKFKYNIYWITNNIIYFEKYIFLFVSWFTYVMNIWSSIYLWNDPGLIYS